MTNFSSDLTTHPSLLLRVRDASDHQAWSEFAKIYGPLIYSYCRRRGMQESDAADVSQEVLSRVAGAIGNFDYRRDKGSFRGWLGTITFRELARFAQGKNKHDRPIASSEAIDDAVSHQNAASDWDDHFHAALLQVALERIKNDFDPMNWQAFQGVWMELESADKVAVRLGISVDKVYVAKSRVLKRLRSEILTLSEDSPLATH